MDRINRPLLVLAASLALSAAAPARAEKVDYDKLFHWEARAEPAEVAPGGRGEIVVTLSVAPDHHVYGDKTEVVPTPAPGLRWDPVLRPAGAVKPDPLTGKDRELLVGTAAFRLPYAVEADAPPGKRRLALEASYQG
ncbi:MAG: protein-disulfide reductase DsbD N-terminal domain-containing protein, partial [Candidatus Methylomirabilis sp.]|nr:protein-disulfide reductase DsbD N-terminal domain-containing protein [Deltaproteobacteria bacterium]